MPYILGDEDFFVIYDQAAYLKAKGSPAKLIAAKIYTGPYVVTDANDQIMHEVRNPIYWDGTPKLSEVTVKFITDAESRILAVEHGEADLALYPPTTAAKTLKGPHRRLLRHRHAARPDLHALPERAHRAVQRRRGAPGGAGRDQLRPARQPGDERPVRDRHRDVLVVARPTP